MNPVVITINNPKKVLAEPRIETVTPCSHILYASYGARLCGIEVKNPLSCPNHKNISSFPQNVFNGLLSQCHKPFPKRQILHSSKLEETADNNFEIKENSGKLSKRVQNTVGKEEIAHYKPFLLFPECVQKTCTPDTYKPGLVWERVKTGQVIVW